MKTKSDKNTSRLCARLLLTKSGGVFLKKIDFNEEWQFWKEGGDRQNVTLPHDAMIHEQRDPECKNGKNTGYFPGG